MSAKPPKDRASLRKSWLDILAITAWGLDGLEVAVPMAFAPAISKAGQSETFVIPFTPSEGRSNLAVSISGTFHGAKLQRVATFAIGTGPVKPSPGETIVTDQGETLKGSRAATPKPQQPPAQTTP